MYPHFGHVYSEITSLHLEIISFIYINIYLQLKKNQKRWNEMKTKPCIEQWDEEEWDENETLHLLMMMVKKLSRNLFT